jgi:hypothetical protein
MGEQRRDAFYQKIATAIARIMLRRPYSGGGAGEGRLKKENGRHGEMRSETIDP